MKHKLRTPLYFTTFQNLNLRWKTTPASRRLSTPSRFNNRKSLRFAVWKSLDWSNNRSRPIEIELQFDRRLAMSNAKFLKGTNTFDKPKLRWRHRLSEKFLLDVRFKLTEQSLTRQNLVFGTYTLVLLLYLPHSISSSGGFGTFHLFTEESKIFPLQFGRL